ncbi:unnamed protein product, partial [Heterosigma akashiwo]
QGGRVGGGPGVPGACIRQRRVQDGLARQLRRPAAHRPLPKEAGRGPGGAVPAARVPEGRGGRGP